MGLSIDREKFEDEEFFQFGQRLTHSLQALDHVLKRPQFGEGPCTIGAELELSIINNQGQALPINRTLLNCSQDEHLQLELDRFNLEYNLSPVLLTGRPFSHLRIQLSTAIQSLAQCASGHGDRIVPIGILGPPIAEIGGRDPPAIFGGKGCPGFPLRPLRWPPS